MQGLLPRPATGILVPKKWGHGMSFEQKIPMHRAELEGRLEEIRVAQAAMQTPRLGKLHEELEEAENEVQRLEEEIDDELTEIQESPAYVAYEEEATAVADELTRVNKYAARLDVAKVKG